MALVLLIGGARSGKSAHAVRLARSSRRPVLFVATAEARDEEMAARIRRHQSERPAEWQLVEEPLAVRAALERAEPEAFVVLDCLSLWVANLLERGTAPAAIEQEAKAVARLAAGRAAPTLAVTNEVGLGVVPVSRLGRSFRDVLGRVNAAWAEQAVDAAFVVTGRLLSLARPESSLLGLDD
jgi:adenosyl cobinamide kinase/adenosyl cobinamide phosphate guanylyltransferase